MKFILLADNPSALPLIAKWYSDEWGHIGEGRTTKEIELKLGNYLNRDKLPLIILAQEGEQVIAAAQLRYHEMDIYPEREHWLGGVYVDPNYRNKQVAKSLVEAVIAKANQLAIKSINLQTENQSGGLYLKLGWQPVEQVIYHGIKVLVMEKLL
ncbi:GNAT family N-acetyltransferase [Shewanella sp. 0m-4]